MTVSIQALHKAYGQNPVVRGLDLELGQGEIFTLLGPSGCGKTTTLRMIAGLERPDSGSITIGGDVVAGSGVFVPPERRRLGMVFQSYAVWPHMNVLSNVAYPLRLARDPAADDKARQMLDKVRLSGLEARYPHMLSGGQQQRVALARALVAHPKVLLLDEPLSNLDAGLREELRVQIVALAREQGLTVLLVTHDQEEALGVSDRVGVMHQGLLQQVAPPRELYREPANAFVAGFVGVLNTLPGLRKGGVVEPGSIASAGPEGPVEVGFRPEMARLSERGIPCTIEASAFRGATTRYRVRVGERQVVVDADGPPGPRLELLGGWVL